MATATMPALQFGKKPAEQSTTAYKALVLFTFLYYYRPCDFIPGLQYIPMEKITGGIALLALVASLGGKNRPQIPTAVKVLMLLFGQMMLASIFAVWKGGALSTTINKFSKGVIVAMLIGMIISSISQMRRLFLIQATAVTLVAVGSVIVNHGKFDRLYGIQKGILENPNDLAINIAITFPLCVAFLISSKGVFKKLLWIVGMVFMLYAVYATLSRSGLIAMVMSGLICFWAYGIKGRRMGIIAGAALLGLVGLGVVATSTTYRARVQSIFAGNVANSQDDGSMAKRTALLKESLKQTALHPIFGVGPGCFPMFTDHWQVAHNTYTEFSAEAGIMALSLFLLALTGAFRNVKKLRTSPGYLKDPEVRLYTDALWASLAAYVSGAAFSSTEYNLFCYFIIAYTCALYRIGFSPVYGEVEPEVKKSKWTRLPEATAQAGKLAWTR